MNHTFSSFFFWKRLCFYLADNSSLAFSANAVSHILILLEKKISRDVLQRAGNTLAVLIEHGEIL